MNPDRPSAKEHYQQLRHLPCERLWAEEVPAFDLASPGERLARVAVVRAVGVVFSETGTAEQRARARAWLAPLLRDPAEKVRRYAMAALPKLGAAAPEEAALLALLDRAATDRERRFVGQTLEKIGGAATLAAAAGRGDDPALARTRRKAAANVARRQAPGAVRLDRPLAGAEGLAIHLHCRRGLERFVEDELHEQSAAGARFRLRERGPGRLTISPLGAFTLGDLFALRCFSEVGLVLGPGPRAGEPLEALASVIAAPATRRILEAFTEGALRYRLEFPARGHQRGAIRRLGDLVHARDPALLNDSRAAPWQIEIRDGAARLEVELRPRLRPDPRFAYRRGDVPAASHPPLAAAMARLAGPMTGEVAWDPFCGSGLELIERARRGGVARLLGTDLSAAALATARENLAAAGLEPGAAALTCGDFRDHARLLGLGAGGVSLVITNPPLGRRVPIPDLRGLIADLFAAAAAVLRPGGRLVFVNPGAVRPATAALACEFRERVDLGGFSCHLERYAKRV